MTYRTISQILTIVVLLAMSQFGAATAVGMASEKPNVVLIYIDDLGYGDLGVYGCTDIPTPNIDRLADEGVRCTASYIPNPPCCPSRCSLMMGQYAQRFGKYGMSRGLAIPADRPTLARFLRDSGYVTGQVGKWDIGTKQQGPLNVGFTEVAKSPPKKKYAKAELARIPKNQRKSPATSKYFCINEAGETVWLTDYNGDSMVDFIDRHKAEPFFLYWSPEAVHSPSTEAPERLTDRTRAQGKRRKLAGAIVSVDDQVGKLLDVLNKHGLRRNTLVIFSSDNGANPGEGGSSSPYTGGKGEGTQKEGWVRVPTIFSMPGVLPKGKQYDGLMANFDFYSTIVSMAGQKIPNHCDGVDLVPYLTGERTGDAHEYLFWLNNEPGDAVRRHLIAVRWKDWRLYRKYEKDQWQLFDLKSDPGEERDVASKHPDVVKRMASQHGAWSKTLAPLGEIPKIPAGPPIIPGGHGWAFASANDNADDGWEVLFNGKDLTGWRTLSGKEGAFTVVNGTIRANAKAKAMDHLFYVGDLTDGLAQFRNFELELFARAESNSNSGIFIHTDRTTWTNRLYLNTGYEIQLNSTEKEKRKTGSLYDVVDLDKSLVDEAKWFRVNITVEDKRITVKLDGQQVVDYTEPARPERSARRKGRVLKPQGGAIALQAHDPDSVFYFKDIRVRRLP